MEFEWDASKAAKNLRAHNVSFHEAANVFGDSLSITAMGGADIAFHVGGRNRVATARFVCRGLVALDRPTAVELGAVMDGRSRRPRSPDSHRQRTNPDRKRKKTL